MPDIPAFEQARPIEPPKVHYNTDFNPFKTSSASSYGGGGNYSRPQSGVGGALFRFGKSQQDERADGGRAFCRGYGYRYGSKRGGDGSLFPGNGSFPGQAPAFYGNEATVEKGAQHFQFKGVLF